MAQQTQVPYKFKVIKLEARKNNIKEANKKTRIYFFYEGENVIDNNINRHSRPQNEYRKLIPDILTQSGLNPELKAGWSQYAGCKCPCSPGFVVHEHKGMEIFVTITAEMGA